MALNEEQIAEIKKAAAKYLYYNRPPLEIRDKVDLAYRIEGQSVYVFEIRPRWDNPKVKMESPVAKTTYIKSTDVWKVYWIRSTMKWDLYEPVPYVRTIYDFFDLVQEDEHNCFFG